MLATTCASELFHWMTFIHSTVYKMSLKLHRVKIYLSVLLHQLFCSQVAKMEPKNNSTDVVQLKKASNSPITIDGHGKSNDPVNSGLFTASTHDVNTSLIAANPVKVLISEVNAAENNVTDDHEHGDGSKIRTVDADSKSVNSQSVKSSQDAFTEIDGKLESRREAGMKPDEILCLATLENVDVNESVKTTMNFMHTSPHTSEGPCQDHCSGLSPGDLPVIVDLHSPESLRSLGLADQPNAEAKCIVTKNCSAGPPVNDDHRMLAVRGSGEMTELQFVTRVTSESHVQLDSVTETALSSPEKATIVAKNCSAELPVNDERSMLVARESIEMSELLSDTRVTENPVQHDTVTETSLSNLEKATIVAKNCSAESSVNDEHSMLVVKGSGEMTESLSDTNVTSQYPVQQDSVTETGGGALSSLEKATVVAKHCSIEPPVNDEHSMSVVRGSREMAVSLSDTSVTSERPVQQDSVTETSGGALSSPEKATIVARNCSIESPTNDEHNIVVVRDSREMSESLSDISVTSERPVQQDSAKEIGGSALSSLEKTTTEISFVKAQYCQSDVCPVEASMLMVDVQNSPVQFRTTSSIGCSPIQLPTTVDEVSYGDAQLAETVECLVQTSPRLVDGSISPLHHVMTCSIGCSPAEVKTRSAGTSPILFPPTVGSSMQTDPWMTDAQCSPMVLPDCGDSHVANAMTSPQQYSTKHSTASSSSDIPQSQTTAENTSPSFQQNSPLPAFGEVFCQKISTAESESSYATPTVTACSEDPQKVAVTDCQKSFEDSTQPHSCEELFDDSPLSHQPHSTCPSQRSHLQASPSGI